MGDAVIASNVAHYPLPFPIQKVYNTSTIDKRPALSHLYAYENETKLALSDTTSGSALYPGTR